MARLSDIVRGLEIIKRYCKPDVHMGGAEHDVIYAPPLDRPLTEDAERELRELGWRVSNEDDLWEHYC